MDSRILPDPRVSQRRRDPTLNVSCEQVRKRGGLSKADVACSPSHRRPIMSTSAEPQPVKKKNWFLRHKIISTLLALIVIGIIGGASGGNKGGTAATTTSSSDSSSSAASAAAPSITNRKASTKPVAKPKPKSGVGTAVRDGKFQFVVSSVKCGVKRIGDSFMGDKAQGQFCLVHIKVSNIGSESQTLDSSSQFGYDTKGHKFDTDDNAAVDLPQSQTFLNDINPGNKVNGEIVFDIPKGDKLTSLELHDSAFSDGVRVSL